MTNEFGHLSAETVGFLVQRHDDDIKAFRHWRGNADMKLVGIEAKLDDIHKELSASKEAVEKMNRRTGQVILSIMAGCITFAFSVLAATGHI